MPDRTIRESWAILCEDGRTAHDMAGRFEYDTKETAADYLRDFRPELSRVNACASFRVARVRLLEVEEKDE